VFWLNSVCVPPRDPNRPPSGVSTLASAGAELLPLSPRLAYMAQGQISANRRWRRVRIEEHKGMRPENILVFNLALRKDAL